MTGFVQAGGSGTYTVANVTAESGTSDRNAGWSLAIVYRDPAAPPRNLTVFDGFAGVSSSSGNDEVSIHVDGFTTPPSGAVNASLGALAYDGDKVSDGDSLSIKGDTAASFTTLSNTLNPPNDFFNSTISRFGSYVTDKEPNYNNQLGFDLDVVSTSGVIPNNDTGATLHFTTSSETYFLGVVTTSVDLYAPVIGVDKSVEDLNGGDVLPGDVLEYTVTVTNTGQDDAISTVLTDPIPAGTSYVPGSLEIVSGPNSGTKTDASGDDQAEFDSGNGNVVFRLGTGADATSGGTLNEPGGSNTTSTISFQVAVASDITEPTDITNQAEVAYVASTLGTGLTSNSNDATVSVVPTADLSITKTSDPSPYIPNADLQYIITVTNNGPSNVVGASVVDDLPAVLESFTWTCLADDGSSCVASGSGDIDTTVDLQSGDSAVFTLAGTAPSGSDEIENAATVTVPTGVNDPDLTNNTTTTNTPGQPQADLSITKSSLPSPYVPGEDLTYTITVTNDGPSDATGVTVTDTLPPVLAGFSWTCEPDSGSLCLDSSGNGNINTTVDLESEDSATFTLSGTVPSSATEQIENTASIIVPDDLIDPDDDDHSATNQNDPDPQADLSITKTDNADSVVPGESSTYYIQVTNSGPSDVTGASITDTVPAAITDVEWTCSPSGTASCVDGDGTGNVIDTTANLPAGTTVTYTVTGTVSPSATGSLENTASVAVPSGVTDPDGDNNDSTDTTTLTPTADVSVTKSSSPASYVPGESITYTIIVTNSGPSDVQGITVTDDVPDALTNVNWTCVADAGSTCPAGPISGDIDTTVDLASGDRATLTITADIPSSLRGELSNAVSANVPDGVNDPDPNNNGDTDGNSPSPRADLMVTKSSSPNPFTPGTDLTYTIVVTNNGPSDVTGAGVNDTVPSVLGTVSWTCLADPGSACSATPLGDGDLSTTVDIQSGDSVTFTATATAPSDAAVILANDVTVTPPAGVTDPNLNNNSDHDQNPFDIVADLSISKDDGSTTAVAGLPIEYTIVVANNGPSDVVGATITDSVPASITDVSWTCQATGSADCGADAGNGNAINTTADIPVGESVTITVSGTVDPSATGTLENFASVDVPGNVNDPNDSNDSDSDTSTITTQADVSVTKTSTPESYVPGSPLTYTITVSNSGPSDVAGVLVTDDLPTVIESFTWTCAPDSGSSCATAIGSGDISTTVDLASGESAVFTISGTVPSNANARIDNTVIVTVPPDVDDPDPSNDTSTNENEPTPSSDLSITKSSTPNPYTPGAQMIYTIKVTNNGPSDVVDAIVTDDLPTAVETFEWECVADPGSTCDVSSGSGDIDTTVDLEAGDSAIFTLSGIAPSGPILDLVNVATVTPPDGVTDPDPTDNTDTEQNPADPTADVSVTKTSSPESYIPGAPITYTITVINSGPSDVAGVTVTDDLPDALTNVEWVCQPDLGSLCGAGSGDGDIDTTVDLESGDRATFIVTANVPSSLTGQLVNTVSTEMPDDVEDPDPENNTTTNTSDPDPMVDLSVTKSSNPNPYVPGQALTYTIVVTNNGLSDVIGATVNDDVPAILEAFEWTCEAEDSSLCGAGSGTGDIDTTVDLQAGDSATFTFTGTVPSSAVDQFSNTVNVGVPEGVTDPQDGNNTATDMNPANPTADLTITKTDNADTAIPGESITYTIVVSNPGPSDAPNASIIDNVPASITDVTWTCVASGTATCGADSGSGNAISTTADLPAGTSVTYEVTGTISPSATGSLSNTASVDVPTGVTDPIRSNNTSTDTNELTPMADVVVTKVSDPEAYVPGEALTYTIVVTNEGPSDVAGVTVVDDLPTVLETFTWSCVADDGSLCGADEGTGDINTTVDLQAGDSATFTVEGTVPSSETGTISNTVTATVPDDVDDPNEDDNTTTVESPANPIADLAVTKTSSPSPFVPGEDLTYTIVVTNAGPSDVTGVTVSDDLPDSLENFSWTCEALPESACGVESGTGGIEMTVDIVAGGSVTITLTGDAPFGTGGNLSNTVTVTVPEGVTDPDPSNNTATAEDGSDPQAPDCYNFDIGEHAIFFPWVGNDDPSTGLGNADTSVTVQNLTDYESFVVAWIGVGDDSLPGNNGWDVVGPFYLEAHASKTISAAELGIADGEGAPIAFSGFNVPLANDSIVPGEDLNGDGDTTDYEIIAESSGSWVNPDGTEVTWADDDCLVIDVDGMSMTVSPLDSLIDPTYCLDAEFSLEDGTQFKQYASLGGYAKQAVDGENLPYTSDADSAVSGYNAISGWELTECDLGWYLPIVQTNGGPGGAWNSIIRVANFGDTFGGGFIGAAGVTVTIYPADNGGGELGKSHSFNLLINAGQTKYIDLSAHVPEGYVGSAHIQADAPVFAMVDRVKVGYSDWITNTATNATLEPRPDGKYVLYAPDVRKDWFGWNTGINVANMADYDNQVTIQYVGDSGAAAQTAELHARGMTYFYDPSQAPQDNSNQDPVSDVNPDGIGAAIIISDGPVAVAVDATKYPESTTSNDPNVFQALSYSATRNLFTKQFVPLVQKGNPDTGMGATSGIQIFNPNDASAHATVIWHIPSGDVVGNPVSVVVNPNAMTFVYSMTDAQLSTGFLGSADVYTDLPVTTISTQVDYAVEFDGSAVWNGYNPCGGYRTISEGCAID